MTPGSGQRSDRRLLDVLMVTGAYYPEFSGGGLQARAVVRALRRDVRFSVLTTTTDRALPSWSDDEGVPVRRIYVDVHRSLSELWALVKLVRALLDLAERIDVVNVHGFSRKAILFAMFSRLFRRPFVLTLQTGVHDEPRTARAMGRVAYWAFTNADMYLSVSPGLSQAYLDAGLPAARLRQVSNAVDVERFRPAAPAERARLRAELGLPGDRPLILFVGFFSRDKRPDVVYDAWSRLAAAGSPAALLFIGATRSSYQEIDVALADRIRGRAAADGLTGRLFFVETTPAIERYFRAADVYVLPSVREGLPVALLEAMASGVASVASRLAGSTDGIIAHGVNGLLVTPDDRGGFVESIATLLREPATADRLGAAARATIVERFSIQRTAPVWLAAYTEAVDAARAAGSSERQP